jgi:anti-sigma regulatory factor (Ser/Thr protein kinase)
VVTAQYPSHRHAAGRARRLVTGALAQWRLDEVVGLSDAAALLTSELVANAVVHGAGPIRVVVAITDGSLEVGVSDLHPHPPRVRAPEDRLNQTAPPAGSGSMQWVREGGRGMLLVQHLAEAWGTSPAAEGKQVWFRLKASPWLYAAACDCAEAGPNRLRLGSGRSVHEIPPP